MARSANVAPFLSRNDNALSANSAKSLTFDTEPLTERLEILGSAVLEAEIAVDQPLALLAARLNDVAPDGTSLRVALAVLNLTHRDSHHTPQPLQPGRRYKIRLGPVVKSRPVVRQLERAW